MVDDKELIAKAEAEDYEELVPADRPCKNNLLCHIIGAFLLTGCVVGLITLGFAFFN